MVSSAAYFCFAYLQCDQLFVPSDHAGNVISYKWNDRTRRNERDLQAETTFLRRLLERLPYLCGTQPQLNPDSCAHGLDDSPVTYERNHILAFVGQDGERG